MHRRLLEILPYRVRGADAAVPLTYIEVGVAFLVTALLLIPVVGQRNRAMRAPKLLCWRNHAPNGLNLLELDALEMVAL